MWLRVKNLELCMAATSWWGGQHNELKHALYIVPYIFHVLSEQRKCWQQCYSLIRWNTEERTLVTILPGIIWFVIVEEGTEAVFTWDGMGEMHLKYGTVQRYTKALYVTSKSNGHIAIWEMNKGADWWMLKTMTYIRSDATRTFVLDRS